MDSEKKFKYKFQLLLLQSNEYVQVNTFIELKLCLELIVRYKSHITAFKHSIGFFLFKTFEMMSFDFLTK